MAETPAASRGPRGATGKTGRPGKNAVTPDAYLAKADELQRSLDGVRAEMRAQTDEIEAANKTANDANKSARRSKRASRIALVAAVLAIIGLVQARSAIHDIIVVRNEGAYARCQADNKTRQEAIKAKEDAAKDLIAASHNLPFAKFDTLHLTTQEANYVISQRARAAEAYDHRDCSTDGIKKFNKHPFKDPERCVPDGKGLCK